MPTFNNLNPLAKTIVLCALAECVIVALVFCLTTSLTGAALISFGLLGPVSFWIGPLILQHYQAKGRLQRQAALAAYSSSRE